jgi:hypothetical protein
MSRPEDPAIDGGLQMSATPGRKAPVFQPALIIDRGTALPAFPRYERLALRAIGINEFVWLHDEPSSPESAHQDLPVR